MGAYPLLTDEDLDTVRALLLPNQTTQTAQIMLPIFVLMQPSVGGRAEAIIKQRLGTDWIGFVSTPPVIPTYYAQGDADLAVQLFHDAMVQFTCARVVASGIMHQLTPNLQKLPNVTVETIVPWPVIQANFEMAGRTALNLLRRPFPVAGRTFASPSAGASGEMATCIQTGTPLGQRRW